jgi:hypothetical protein
MTGLKLEKLAIEVAVSRAIRSRRSGGGDNDDFACARVYFDTGNLDARRRRPLDQTRHVALPKGHSCARHCGESSPVSVLL